MPQTAVLVYQEIPLRKCYLCDLPAFVCQKNKTHTQDELEFYYLNKVRSYFNNIAEEMIKSSIITELNLDPKFGLVTPKLVDLMMIWTIT